MSSKICFGQDKSMCIPLTKVRVMPSEPSEGSLAVMNKAGSLDGLRVIACDYKRRCSLFYAKDNLTDGLFLQDTFPYDPWSNTTCNIKTSFDFSSLYLITPDHRILEYKDYKVGLLEYMGEGRGLLLRREEVLNDIKNIYINDIKKKIESGSGKDALKKYGDPKLFNVDPFAIWLKYGLDFFTTPSPDVLESPIELAIIRFNSWSLQQEDYPIKSCLKDVNFAFSLYSLGGDPKVEAVYNPKDNLIKIAPRAADALLSGGKSFGDTMAHECKHADFEHKKVRSEVIALLGEGLGLARQKLMKEERYDEKEVENIYSNLEEKISNNDEDEIRAYSYGRPEVKEIRILERLDYIASNYPASAVLYLFDRLEEFLTTDKNMDSDRLAYLQGLINKERNKISPDSMTLIVENP